MKHIIKHIFLILLIPVIGLPQDTAVLQLDEIFRRIDENNLQLQSYAMRAEAYEHNAEAATAWMAPMAGAGTFMTPYPFKKVVDHRDKGQLMLTLEQDIPNPAKLRAKKKYVQSQANAVNVTRDIILNQLRSDAKRFYFTWLIAVQKIDVLQRNEQLLEMMKKIEEVRFPYNQSQLSTIYLADAEIEKNRNMIRMQEGEIATARARLNGLMNNPGNDVFNIDTSYDVSFSPQSLYDTSELAVSRKDIQQMNESIRSMQLNIETIRMEKKPDFRIRFDHMYPLDRSMPGMNSIMGMVSIPIAPWSSKMYKSEIKAMDLNVRAMETERAAMLQEAQGMLYGMQNSITAMQQRIRGLEEKVIPSLRNALDAAFIRYQENKLQLASVISAWEAVTMMESDILDEKLKLYSMIVDYEKELYR